MSSVSMPVLPQPGARNTPELERVMAQGHAEIAAWMEKYPVPEGAAAHWYIAVFRPGANQLRIQASYDFDLDQLRMEADFTAIYASEAEVLYACDHLADMKLKPGNKNILKP